MPGNPRDEFEALSRRYWAAWGDALRAATPDASVDAAGAQPWQQAFDAWARMARGPDGADPALGHFDRQAREWYARMHEVAARFAGQAADPAEVAAAWREALGGDAMPGWARALGGPGMPDLEAWMQAAAPWLGAARAEGLSWLRLPAFGAGREHQERLQALAAHMVELQDATARYSALMLQAQREALPRFEERLAGRDAPGRRIESARALFDLWIDAAEEAYAGVALSEEFRRAYGRLVNAQMQVRAGVQRLVEDACAQLGMPTRSELDGAHRKIVQLEREVRALRDAVAAAPRPPAAKSDAARLARAAKSAATSANAQRGRGKAAKAPGAGAKSPPSRGRGKGRD